MSHGGIDSELITNVRQYDATLTENARQYDATMTENSREYDAYVEEQIVIGGGVDVSDTTAVESDVASGKVFHKANGDRAVGTLILSSASIKDVNLVDYDGKILYSYTKAEFAALTALPSAPTHSGLVSEGWMYTLAQAKAQAASDGKLYVGHFYNTTDGRTRIKVRLFTGRLSCYLGLCVNGTATVDWGDGTATNTVTGSSLSTIVNTSHTWASAGDYDIYINVPSGSSARIIGTASYGQLLWTTETASASRDKNYVYASGILELNVGNNMQIGSAATSMMVNAIISYPAASSLYSTYYLFTYVHTPDIICLPYGLTTTENYAFANSEAKAVQLPDTLTSISKDCFYNAKTLSSIVVPSNVTSIGAEAFYNCYGLGEIHFKPSTPPTVANSNAWTNLPTDCKIYVPSGKLSAYTGATNYPSSSTYTYVEE